MPLLLLLAGLALGPAAWAQAPAADEAPAAHTVGAVRIAGAVHTDSVRILRTFEVAPGARYSADAVRRGLRKLYALGLFADVWVERIERGEIVDLVVHVREQPRLSRIDFAGNRHRETSELERRLFVRVGETYSPVRVASQVDSLLRYYRGEGYSQATVAADVDSVTPVEVTLRFTVHEGERVRITRIVFEGAEAFASKTLRRRLKTKAKGFFGGGEVNDAAADEDRERLEAFYRDRGFRDARLISRELRPGATPRELTLVIGVDEGRRYRQGAVAWSGVTAVAPATLERLWQPRPGELYNRSRIERVQGQAYAAYAEEGYLYLGIEPRESIRDSIVDVTFVAGEGRPSAVRLVHVSGNRATREKVIRREIDIHEGDRFRRSALVRSQGDIMRLGLFEDVQFDFAPAESTDVDITIRVKEKNVGTASAGAGYSGESGLTGFIQIGHNNVLGNGQSLSLHLERGRLRREYQLSFTEPWFRDTPTLLGFSVFSSERERDLFREERVGGSVRVGRPLPWPDFSRGSIAYRLEDVTIRQLGATLTAQDSLALSGIPLGVAVRTSSVETNFLRNSTDNPFYPTRGTRLSASSEFAGGPFAGAVHFHKHRVEGRIYLPSLVRGVTTMARARVGLVGPYADQQTPIPAYERFRLGGGTTPDPLRGYDDYMVVPAKFNREVETRVGISAIDTLKTPPDTLWVTRTTRVRYPGGRFMSLYTLEQQFPIVHPLRGVVFFDAGNTWDLWREIRPLDLKLGLGVGFRLEIPLLGNIGFDYGYGFHRDDRPRAVGHFLIGPASF